MKKNGAVSNTVLGIIIFAAVFILLKNSGCSSCSSSCAGCIACNAYSCVSGCASGAGGRAAEVSSSCTGPQTDNGQGGASLTQKDSIYINDYADTVTEAARQSIIRMGSELEQQSGAQLAVVVINNSAVLGNDEIKNYTFKLFNDWGVGSKNNDGVLLVINTAEGASYTGNAWCVIGTGLEKLLPASDVGEIIDNEVIPCLDESRFSDAALNGYTALYEKLINILGG